MVYGFLFFSNLAAIPFDLETKEMRLFAFSLRPGGYIIWLVIARL